MSEENRLIDCLAYLASCQAATLESLPKSAPKSQRRRHTEIARTALGFLEGKMAVRPTGAGWTMDRLDAAIKDYGI